MMVSPCKDRRGRRSAAHRRLPGSLAPRTALALRGSWRWSAAFVLLMATACASTTSARAKLDLAARDVFDALQYGDFQLVAAYLEPEHRTDFLARAYGVEKKLEVMEFTPVGLDVDQAAENGRMVTRISWFELPSTIVQTENVLIDWRRGKAGWQIRRIVGGPLPVPGPDGASEVGTPAGETPNR